jgi:hypothetical protein
MKKVLVVLAAAFATAAIAVTPAFADGSTTWDGQGLDEGETCATGAHWLLVPAQGIESATLTVDGAVYPMTQNGAGAFAADSVGSVDESTDASATWTGSRTSAFLTLSHCLGSSTTTTTTTTTTGTPTTTTAGPTTSTTSGGPTTSTTSGGPTSTTAGPTSTTGSGGVLGGSTTCGTTGGTTGGTAPSGGNLPFTGLPIWIPLLAAASLLASGIMLIRRRKGEIS